MSRQNAEEIVMVMQRLSAAQLTDKSNFNSKIKNFQWKDEERFFLHHLHPELAAMSRDRNYIGFHIQQLLVKNSMIK